MWLKTAGALSRLPRSGLFSWVRQSRPFAARLIEEHHEIEDEDQPKEMIMKQRKLSNPKRSSRSRANLPMDEFRIYKNLMSEFQIQVFRKILIEKTVKNVTKDQVTGMMFLILRLDVSIMPLSHLIHLSKWAGTGVLRKIDYRGAKTLILRCYEELKKRGYFDQFLVIKEERLTTDSFNPEKLTDSSTQHSRDPELANRLKRTYDWAKSNRSSMLDMLDVLVEFSNIGIYVHEFYQSALVFLDYASKETSNEEEFTSFLSPRVANYVWSFMRVSQQNMKEYERILTVFMKFSSEFNDYKMLYHVQILSIIHFIGDASQKSPETVKHLKEAIEETLKLYDEFTSIRFNPKIGYLICQIMLCLYPEIGMQIRANQLHKLDANPENPFKEYFYRLKKLFIPSIWIVENHNKAKSGSFSSSLTMLKNADSFSLISIPSYYNTSRKFEDRFLKALQVYAPHINIERSSYVGFYEIDFQIGNTVIETYSETHYVSGTQTIILSSLLKELQLKAMGIEKIIYVNQAQFDKDEEACIKEVEAKLAAGATAN